LDTPVLIDHSENPLTILVTGLSQYNDS
jgi:hypothetical protein